MIKIHVEIHEAHGPALRSVVEELSVTVASRAEQPQAYPVEQAVTEALVAVGALRKAVCAAIPAGHSALRSLAFPVSLPPGVGGAELATT